jgi:hypothetical protein
MVATTLRYSNNVAGPAIDWEPSKWTTTHTSNGFLTGSWLGRGLRKCDRTTDRRILHHTRNTCAKAVSEGFAKSLVIMGLSRILIKENNASIGHMLM